MKFIGAHVSASGGVSNAPKNAAKIGANAFALFVKNQRQWSAKPLEKSEIEAFKMAMSECGFKPHQVLPHNGYLINLGHPEAAARQKSIDAFSDEVERCMLLGLTMINFHPGSHLKEISEDECSNLIASSINEVLSRTNGVKLVLENTAGQGSNMGYKFSHLADIIAEVGDKSRIGVCIDTCHLWASGYDFVNDFSGVWEEFDNIVGLKYLSGFHINDSKGNLGSKKDRHDSLGAGTIGWEAFKTLLQDKITDDIPLILETIDENIWSEEIAKLREFSGEK